MGVESLSVDTSKSQVYAYTQLSTQPLAQYIDVANLTTSASKLFRCNCLAQYHLNSTIAM